MTRLTARKLGLCSAVLGLALIGATAVPTEANAQWRNYGWGYGVYPAPVVVPPPPPAAYYAPPPVYYAPPARTWIPAHWRNGYWVPGHWS